MHESTCYHFYVNLLWRTFCFIEIRAILTMMNILFCTILKNSTFQLLLGWVGRIFWTGQKLIWWMLLSGGFGIPWKKGNSRTYQERGNLWTCLLILMLIQQKTHCTGSCPRMDVHLNGLNSTKRSGVTYLYGDLRWRKHLKVEAMEIIQSGLRVQRLCKLNCNTSMTRLSVSWPLDNGKLVLKFQPEVGQLNNSKMVACWALSFWVGECFFP